MKSINETYTEAKRLMEEHQAKLKKFDDEISKLQNLIQEDEEEKTKALHDFNTSLATDLNKEIKSNRELLETYLALKEEEKNIAVMDREEIIATITQIRAESEKESADLRAKAMQHIEKAYELSLEANNLATDKNKVIDFFKNCAGYSSGSIPVSTIRTPVFTIIELSREFDNKKQNESAMEHLWRK